MAMARAEPRSMVEDKLLQMLNQLWSQHGANDGMPIHKLMEGKKQQKSSHRWALH